MLFSRVGITTILVILLNSTGVQAEPLGIGVTRGGANPAIGNAIASIISENAGVNMRPQAFSSGTRYAPLLDIGEVEFGVGNLSHFTLLMEGRFTPNDRPKPNLRLVASLMPFRGAFLVKADSNIESLSDLKGKRIATGFPSQILASVMHEAFLTNGGLTYEDVVPVPATTMRSHWELFKEGRIDGVMMSIGSGVVKELQASLGELRYLPMDNSAEGLAKLQQALPGAYFVTVNPRKKLDGVTQPFVTLAYDYGLWSGSEIPEETVYGVVRALHQNSDAFRAVNPLTRQFDPQEISRPQIVAYHPGALRYFREVGLPLNGSSQSVTP